MHTLLVPTDFSRCAEQALDHALFLARQNGAVLHLLHVIEIPVLGLPHLREEFYVEARKRALADMAILLAARGEGLAVEQVVLPGPPATPAAPVILDYAREHEVDFIVIGTHGRRGVRRLFLGSVAEEVVRMAGCPVLTVREREAPFPAHPLRQVLVPIDFSMHSEQALAEAKELALHYQAGLVLLHVVEPPPPPGVYGFGASLVYDLDPIERVARTRLQELAAEVERAGLEAEVEVCRGYAPAQILDFASTSAIDLVVLASHGRTGLDRFVMGSVAEKVIRAAPCPVLVVKAFGRPSGEELAERAGAHQAL